MSFQLSAQAITAQTAITRMSVRRCSTLPRQRGSTTAPKCPTSRSMAMLGSPASGREDYPWLGNSPASRISCVSPAGGPNTRNDFHVNPTEELFYQLRGDIALRVRPLDESRPYDVMIREGDLFLLPRRVPHRPQRPAGTVGLIVEFPRPAGEKDALRWYCPRCDELVFEARWQLKKIDE